MQWSHFLFVTYKVQDSVILKSGSTMFTDHYKPHKRTIMLACWHED